MNDRPFLTAQIDADHAPSDWCDHSCVPWWSFTKTALATAALQLVDRGYLDLDDRIDDRLYTLRQLLQHRAGVPNYGGLASYHDAVARGEKPWDVAQMLNRVRVDHLDYEPGCGWNYSNVGYYFVRLKIEQVTSQDIGSALRQLVFDPLGLASVRLVPTVEDFAGTEWAIAVGMIPAGSIMGCSQARLVVRYVFCTSSCPARCCDQTFSQRQ